VRDARAIDEDAWRAMARHPVGHALLQRGKVTEIGIGQVQTQHRASLILQQGGHRSSNAAAMARHYRNAPRQARVTGATPAHGV